MSPRNRRYSADVASASAGSKALLQPADVAGRRHELRDALGAGGAQRVGIEPALLPDQPGEIVLRQPPGGRERRDRAADIGKEVGLADADGAEFSVVGRDVVAVADGAASASSAAAGGRQRNAIAKRDWQSLPNFAKLAQVRRTPMATMNISLPRRNESLRRRACRVRDATPTPATSCAISSGARWRSAIGCSPK